MLTGDSYTFNISRASQDYPKIYTRTIWGIKQFRWDVSRHPYPQCKPRSSDNLFFVF